MPSEIIIEFLRARRSMLLQTGDGKRIKKRLAVTGVCVRVSKGLEFVCVCACV